MSARGRIWACDTWGMTKLYAKSQLLQGNMFEKRPFHFCKKKSDQIRLRWRGSDALEYGGMGWSSVPGRCTADITIVAHDNLDTQTLARPPDTQRMLSRLIPHAPRVT
jgi:hypothetical protein